MSQIRSKNGWIELPIINFTKEDDNSAQDITRVILPVGKIKEVCELTAVDAFEYHVKRSDCSLIYLIDAPMTTEGEESIMVKLPYELLSEFIMDF